MSRQDANAAFARTSFLYGGNAAYIEDLYARYERDPKALDAAWQSFFQSLKDDRTDVERNAEGPSWQRPDWPPLAANELTGALDPGWQEAGATIGGKLKAQAQARGATVTTAEVERATRDSIRALMLIRAYRARGHFHANLDPLGLEPPQNEEELDPRTYGFGDTDLDRPIFLDNVLGLQFGTFCAGPIVKRSALNSCIFPAPRRKAGSRSASRGLTRKLPSRAKASAPSSTSWLKPKASRNSPM